jgi:hypothetical protein
MAKKKKEPDGLEPATVKEYERLIGELQAYYNEISTLSKKNPDGLMNKFKLGFINGTLMKANVVLGKTYRPFTAFEAFDEVELPSTSDVGMILSQYLNSMTRFKKAYTYEDEFGDGWYWDTTEGEMSAD